jgi:hypothetical protein
MDLIPSALLATQIPPGPLAIAAGWVPTLIGTPTVRRAGILTRVTVPSALLATQALSPSTVIAAGAAPTWYRWTTSWVCGLTWDTVSSLVLTAQTYPAPYAIPVGFCPTATTSCKLPSA